MSLFLIIGYHWIQSRRPTVVLQVGGNIHVLRSSFQTRQSAACRDDSRVHHVVGNLSVRHRPRRVNLANTHPAAVTPAHRSRPDTSITRNGVTCNGIVRPRPSSPQDVRGPIIPLGPSVSSIRSSLTGAVISSTAPSSVTPPSCRRQSLATP